MYLRRLNRRRRTDSVRGLSWASVPTQIAQKLWEANPLTEKEGFEPSLSPNLTSRGPAPTGQPMHQETERRREQSRGSRPMDGPTGRAGDPGLRPGGRLAASESRTNSTVDQTT